MIYGDSLSLLSLASSYTGGISRFPHRISIFMVPTVIYGWLLIATEETGTEPLHVCDRSPCRSRKFVA